MKKIFKYILAYFIIVIIINLSFWALVGLKFSPVAKINSDGIIIKIDKFNYAMVFAHGDYALYINSSYSHRTKFNGSYIKTIDLLDELYAEGYTRVWLSQCSTGNYDWMIHYKNGTTIDWYDWVSRNKNKGTTIPIFTGINFVRI